MGLVVTVAELLAASITEHRAAMGRNRKRNPMPKHKARVLLRQAYDLRKQAHELDPEHKDDAWRAEDNVTPTGRDTHEELMTFYRETFGG